jgi:predicted nucleic acid-binding Zn ribbon protein
MIRSLNVSTIKNTDVSKPIPPEKRIECGYCFEIMPESKYKTHTCYFYRFIVPGILALCLILTVASIVPNIFDWVDWMLGG